MKRNIPLVITTAIVLLLSACRAHMPVSQQSGKDDTAALIFVSASNRGTHEITVTLDDKNTFTATTVKSRKAIRRGTQYTVKTGTRKIKVTDKGQVVYEKKIFLSAGETKEIQLP